SMMGHPWELVDGNADEIMRDFADLGFTEKPSAVSSAAVVGPADRLWVDPSARLEPMVVADTTRGPVVIERNAVIHAFTRLEGPCYVGPRTQVFGAKIRA